MNTIELNKIIVKKDRIRTEIEKIKDIEVLKESIKELGLLHPVVINQDDELIAGYRRLTAYKQLKLKVPLTYDKIPFTRISYRDEKKDLKAELHENIVRKKLSSFDSGIAMKRLKEIYETEHPETKPEAHLPKSGETGFQEKIKRIKYVPKVGTYEKVETDIIKPVYTPAPRFTKKMSKELDVSETTIQDILQVADAIEEGKVSEETKEKFKNREITHRIILKELREQPKKTKKSKPKRKTPTPKEKKYCRDCVRGIPHQCTNCGNREIICTKHANFKHHNYDHIACDRFTAP